MSLAALATRPVLINLLHTYALTSEDGRLWVTSPGIHAIFHAGSVTPGRSAQGYELNTFMSTTGRLFLKGLDGDGQSELFSFDILLCVLEDIHGLSFSPDDWQRLKQIIGTNAARIDLAAHTSTGSRPLRDLTNILHRVGSRDSSGSGTESRRCERVDVDTDNTHEGQGECCAESSTGSSSRKRSSGKAFPVQLVSSLLANKDAKIKTQAKMLKFFRQKCTRLQKQLDQFRSDAANEMRRESQNGFGITRVKSAKAKQKELNCLEANHVEGYFAAKKKRELREDIGDDDGVDNGGHHATRRANLGWLTPEGTLSLAIRRNMSNCSAEDFGLVIMDDCSKQTVLRAECRSASALIASSRLFFKEWMSERCDCHNANDRHCFLWLQYREDATNSSKHRSKMTALELQASYVMATTEDLPLLTPQDNACIRRLADVLPVHRGDGPATLALCKKMLESLGCPTWDTFLEQHELCGVCQNQYVFLMCTTDRGPNEIWAKKAVQAKLRDVPWCFFLPADCYEHQAHLGVLGGLKLVDSLLAGRRRWKYFSSVAMLTNILRDVSQDLYTTWRTLHGDASANKSVRSLFPRCIAERWGSIDLTETRLLTAGIPMLRATLMSVFQCTGQSTTEEVHDDNNPNTTEVDTLAVEEKKEYRNRMGRWRRASISTLQDPLFDGVTQVMNVSRKPFIHLSNYLKAKVQPADNAPMFRLVVGKASSIGRAFEDMLWGRVTRASTDLSCFIFRCID